MSLQEEVAVNNAQYTAMLNNIQQLRVVRAGEVGNVRIVDYAQIERKPSKPNKKVIFAGHSRSYENPCYTLWWFTSITYDFWFSS